MKRKIFIMITTILFILCGAGLSVSASSSSIPNINKVIVPMLIATNYPKNTTDISMSVYDDKIVNSLVTGRDGIYSLINKVINTFPSEIEVDNNWIISPYSPTSTIIEASRTLYESHSVDNITRHEADNVSTDKTISYILDVIKTSKEKEKKVFAL